MKQGVIATEVAALVIPLPGIDSTCDL
jgi:hypothetical protein